jgi:hypothetical protein
MNCDDDNLATNEKAVAENICYMSMIDLRREFADQRLSLIDQELDLHITDSPMVVLYHIAMSFIESNSNTPRWLPPRTLRSKHNIVTRQTKPLGSPQPQDIKPCSRCPALDKQVAKVDVSDLLNPGKFSNIVTLTSFEFILCSCLEQGELIKAKEEVAKTKEELLKVKEEVTALKQKSQASIKASKEEEKTRAKSLSQIASLEKDNERLTEEIRIKSRELKKEHDRAKELLLDIQELKATLDRANSRLQASTKLARRVRERDDDEDDFAIEAPARKRFMPASQQHQLISPQLSIEATIQQQVAEALKRVLPPGFIPQQQSLVSADLYPPPLAVNQYPYGARDLGYGHAREASIQHQAPLASSSTRPSHQLNYQAATSAHVPELTSSTIWPSSQLSLSHDSTMDFLQTTPTLPLGYGSQAPTRSRSPVNEPKPDATMETPNMEMFQAFMDFMNKKK